LQLFDWWESLVFWAIYLSALGLLAFAVHRQATKGAELLAAARAGEGPLAPLVALLGGGGGRR
jgi:hypothetical protein